MVYAIEVRARLHLGLTQASSAALLDPQRDQRHPARPRAGGPAGRRLPSPAPGDAPRPTARDALLAEQSIVETLDLARAADLAFVGIGRPRVVVRDPRLAAAHARARRRSSGPRAGRRRGGPLLRRRGPRGPRARSPTASSALGLDDLLSIPNVVGVAHGRAKTPGVLGALRGHSSTPWCATRCWPALLSEPVHRSQPERRPDHVDALPAARRRGRRLDRPAAARLPPVHGLQRRDACPAAGRHGQRGARRTALPRRSRVRRHRRRRPRVVRNAISLQGFTTFARPAARSRRSSASRPASSAATVTSPSSPGSSARQPGRRPATPEAGHPELATCRGADRRRPRWQPDRRLHARETSSGTAEPRCRQASRTARYRPPR